MTRMLLRPSPEPNRSEDGSRARLAVSRQAPKVVRVAYRDAEGRPQMARIDERRLHAETQRQLAALEASRPELHAKARSAASAQLDAVFASLQGGDRISLLANWYYAYATSYELLRIGAIAGAVAKAGGGSASEAAAAAVGDAVLNKYVALVLRPAVVEPALRRGLEQVAGPSLTHGFTLCREANSHHPGTSRRRARRTPPSSRASASCTRRCCRSSRSQWMGTRNRSSRTPRAERITTKKWRLARRRGWLA